MTPSNASRLSTAACSNSADVSTLHPLKVRLHYPSTALSILLSGQSRIIGRISGRIVTDNS